MVIVVEMELFELIINPDTNANYQPFGRRSLHRLIECRFYHLQNRGSPNVVERRVKCYRWCWWDRTCIHNPDKRLNCATGPAHAVYFGTYEAVKEFAGGNKDDGHHPFAAGILTFRITRVVGHFC
jgi:hypothetical protein